jgi:hypothetical protein
VILSRCPPLTDAVVSPYFADRTGISQLRLTSFFQIPIYTKASMPRRNPEYGVHARVAAASLQVILSGSSISVRS